MQDAPARVRWPWRRSAAKEKGPQGTSPLYLTMQQLVDHEWQRLQDAQLTPWAFLNAGSLNVKNFYGKSISYGGGGFEGSASTVFWGGYIEPFLTDIVERLIVRTSTLCAERGVDLAWTLGQVEGLLVSVVARTYNRMAEIDQRLRGKGFPDSVHRRDVTGKIAEMRQFVEQRAKSELRMAVNNTSHPRTLGSAIRAFNEHPLRIGLALVAAIVSAGFWAGYASRPFVESVLGGGQSTARTCVVEGLAALEQGHAARMQVLLTSVGNLESQASDRAIIPIYQQRYQETADRVRADIQQENTAYQAAVARLQLNCK